MGRKKNGKVKDYALYDLKDNGILLGIFTTVELAKRFETTNGVIRCNISRHQPKGGRYMIEKI